MNNPVQPPAANHTDTTDEALVLSWQYPPGLVSLSVVNLILRVLTLGLYHFWAKTEVRKRVWSAIRINDQPLTYSGRGMELFLGFLIVLGAVLLPITLGMTGLFLAFGPKHIIPNTALVLLYVAFAFLIGIAVYRALRYRLAPNQLARNPRLTRRKCAELCMDPLLDDAAHTVHAWMDYALADNEAAGNHHQQHPLRRPAHAV